MARERSGVEAALEELYGAAPSEFTIRRDALARSLKEAGDASGAADVRSRKKPAQLAYVLNQLARTHGEEVADLVDVGRDLARAQRKALRGEAGHDLRDAITRQRGAVAGLTAKTAALMKTLGLEPDGHLDAIAAALQAALVDPAVGARLEEGRLEKLPQVAAGFPGAVSTEADATRRPAAGAEAKAGARAKAKADARANAGARAKARAGAEAARTEKARARKDEAAKAAMAEALERAREAEEAAREADGYTAHAKKSDADARALAAEAKRLAAETKRLATEAKRVADEAGIARDVAERTKTAAADADGAAKRARTRAERAMKAARAAQASAARHDGKIRETS